MRAAVLRNLNDKVEVLDVTVADPGPGMVRVKIHATGVCHSDLSGVNGTIPVGTPCVLGHEGAGEIVAVGEGVTKSKVGDHVIVAWMPPCGECAPCLRGQPQLCANALMAGAMPQFSYDGAPVFGFAGAGTFAEECVLPQTGVVKIDDDIPWEIASLIGCAVTTGVGAAINTAKVRPGSSCVVFGCGGVGISVIQGCQVAGAADIVAVDLVDSKLEEAKRFGATHAVKPEDLPNLSVELTNGEGFDYAFEAIGNPVTIRAAFDSARRGGTACIVGVGRMDQQVAFNAFEFFFNEKNLVGSLYGSADVRTDFHRILKLWKRGKLDLDGMISRRIGIDDVNEAFDAMQKGEVIRQVITF
jgi:S-(hydroxymethyl)glutathione dehydrogenase / alcohol dehydrogenase